MAYETKVLLVSLADTACRLNSREMYNAIARMANVEGVVLKPYNEAKSEQEEDKEKK